MKDATDNHNEDEKTRAPHEAHGPNTKRTRTRLTTAHVFTAHSTVLRTPFQARSDHIGRNEVRNGLGMGNLGTSCPAARNEVVDLGTRLPKGRNEFGMIILCSDTRIEYMQQSTVFKHFETH